MRNAVLLLLAVLGGAGVGSSGAAVGAEPAPLTNAYGTGVHAYFDGDFQCSFDELSRVVDAGSNDPRVYYFRGLAALKLGRTDEAEADFQQGANLEAEGRGGVGGRAISRALERVQGCDRLALEQFRGRARVAVIERDRGAARQRYSDIYESEAEVLRRRRPERTEPAERIAVPAPQADRATEAEEPAAEETEKPRVEREEPAEPAEKPTDTANPFADEPA